MHAMRNTARIMPAVLALAILMPATTAQSQAEPEAAANQPAETRTLREQVTDLIADLDADSREARAAAQQELLRLGPAALPHLPAPELLRSSVRETVRRIRLALEEQQARGSVQPARVTLSGEMPLGQTLRRVAEQTGNEIDMSALSSEQLNATVGTDFRETTFWAAFDALLQRGELDWSISGEADAIEIAHDEGAAPEPLAVDDSGVYRIAVMSAGLRPVAGRPDERLLRLEVRFTAEPRLRPLFLAFAGRDLRAAAANRTLPPFSPQAQNEIPFGESGKDLRVTWDFRVPGDGPVDTASLSAKASVLTAAGREAIAFDDLVKSIGAARRRGGVTVRLEGVTFVAAQNREGGPDADQTANGTDGQPGRTARIDVSVSYDTGGPAFESHRTWIYHNQAYLEDGDGQRIPYNGFTTELARDGAVAVQYEFDQLAGDADDYKFVYVAPTLLIDVPVEVKLSGIPVSSPPDGERSRP